MNIDLKRLSHLLAVARFKSFSRAARQLGITQSALSRSIQSIEARYSVILFARMPTGVELTPLGRELVLMAQDLLKSSHAMHDLLMRTGRNIGGTLSFGMAPLPAAIILPELMEVLAGEKLERINVAVQRGVVLLDQLIRGEIEFAVAPLVHSVGLEHRLQIQNLIKYEAGLYVRAGHPLTAEPDMKVEQLAVYPVVSTGTLEPTYFDDDLFGYLGNPKIVTDSMMIVVEMMQRANAVILSSSQALSSMGLATDEFVKLDLDRSEDSAPLVLYSVRDVGMSVVSRRAVSRILQICGSPALSRAGRSDVKGLAGTFRANAPD